MNENIETMPTNEMIFEITKLEQEINLKIMKYNLLVREICKRFPIPEIEEEFKMITKGKIKI